MTPEEMITCFSPAAKIISIAGMIFAVCMIAIWICIGCMGGPLARFQPPPPPKVPKPPHSEIISIDERI